MPIICWVLLIATAAYVCVVLLLRIGLSLPPSGADASWCPFVSVVVAARNEEAFLTACIDSLASQTYPADRYEMIVVDDGSDDATLRIAQDAADRHANLKALGVGDAFPEMAAKKRPMSVGIRESCGEIILTTDADCRVEETWIASLVAHFRPDVCAVIGFSQIKLEGSPLSFFERLQALDFLALMSAAAGAASLNVPLAASGQNLGYRRSAFQAVGGFEPIRDRPSGDDVLLLQLMRRAGVWRILFARDAAGFASTWRTESTGGFLRQRRRWASNALLQARLNPPFFAYILTVFLVNALIPICAVTQAGSPIWFLPLACLLGKTLGDWLVIGKGARTFGRRSLLWAFPAWELLQMPYIVWVGLSGSLAGFRWKGRQHR